MLEVSSRGKAKRQTVTALVGAWDRADMPMTMAAVAWGHVSGCEVTYGWGIVSVMERWANH